MFYKIIMLFINKYKCRWKSICGEAQWPTWVPVPWTRGFVEGPHVGGSRGQVHAREFGSYKEHGVMRADSIRNALVCSATVAQKTGAVEHLHRIRIPHIIGASQVLFRPKWWDVRITKQNQSKGTCPYPRLRKLSYTQSSRFAVQCCSQTFFHCLYCS